MLKRCDYGLMVSICTSQNVHFYKIKAQLCVYQFLLCFVCNDNCTKEILIIFKQHMMKQKWAC